MTLTIIGLGPGDPGLLTRRAWQTLSDASDVYLRTNVHPTAGHLPEGPVYHSFDHLYEQADSFADVYDTIVNQLVERVQSAGQVVYAVPGDPFVAEGTVTRLLAVCEVKNIDVEIISGVSFIEVALAALGIDGINGLQLLDAVDVATAHHPPINPDLPALIAQLYSQQVASDVKLTLMNQYPDEHPVSVIHAAGTPDQQVKQVPLYEIDRQDNAHLTTLFIPAFDADSTTSFEGFQETIAHLRAPEGCPWDREQTHESLRKYLLEETYEVIDAIDSGDPHKLMEELGDLLLQVVLHGQIAVDDGKFYMAEVIRHIDTKLKRRHPHVWGEVDVHGDPEQVKLNWEQIKAQERSDNSEGDKSLLDGVPSSMPALAQAHAYDTRAAKVGFDWRDQKGVIDKVHEEIAEILEAKTPDDLFHEIGDLLLVVAVWARWLGLDPEDALRAANKRFYGRFTHIERKAREAGKELSAMTLDEMEALWDDAKRNNL